MIMLIKKHSPVICGLLFAVIYAVFPTKLHYVDGLVWAYNIENFPLSHQFNQHHPIWVPIMHILFYAFKLIIPGLRSLAFLSAFNAILGGISVLLMVKVVERITKNLFYSITAGVIFGSSWVMLNFCTDANIYITIIVIMLITTLVLLSENHLSRKNALIATALVLVASLMHQIAFFFTFVVLAGIIIRSPGRERNTTALICTIMYAAIIIPVNYIIYLHSISLTSGEISMTFPSWLTAYGSGGGWWTFLNQGPGAALKTFTYTYLNAFIHTPRCELLFHARPMNNSIFNIAYPFFYLASVGYLIFEVVLYFRKRNKTAFKHQARCLLLLWLVIYALFNHLFTPFELHHKLFIILPLIILVILRIEGSNSFSQTRSRVFLIILVVAFSIWNISTGLIPNAKPANNEFLTPVIDISSIIQKGDLLLYSRDEFYTAWLARYYTDADVETPRVSFNKFANVNKNMVEIHNHTIEFINERYDRIILSEKALADLKILDHWYFAGLSFPPPHPWLLAIYPESVDRVGEIETPNGEIFYLVNFHSKF